MDSFKGHREEAEIRQRAWAALSPREQLASLDRRLGEGKGALKQRTRLQALLKASTGRPDGRDITSPTLAAHNPGKLKAKDRREQERAQARLDK